MSVKLRLRRGGRKARPYYWIVAADARAPRDGKYIEQVGTYDPMRDPAAVTLDHELALKWLHQGAQPTETVRSILSREGVMLKLHLIRKGKTAEEIERGYQAWKAESDRKAMQADSTRTQSANQAKASAMDAERKKREAIATRIAEKNTPPPAPAAEAPAEAAPEAENTEAAETAAEA